MEIQNWKLWAQIWTQTNRKVEADLWRLSYSQITADIQQQTSGSIQAETKAKLGVPTWGLDVNQTQTQIIFKIREWDRMEFHRSPV